MIRLRQIALAAAYLRPVEQQICSELGLEVCFRDPAAPPRFGLRHGLYPIGDRILEVVSPIKEGTTTGRYLERRGDGGYMVILQTDDLTREKARFEKDQLRVIYEYGESRDGETIHGINLHPIDVGGALLSFSQTIPPESWGWAGHDWQYHALNDVVTDLVAVEIQADDPDVMADRWALAIGLPVTNRVISLDDADIRFVDATDGRGDGLAAADLVAADRNRAGEVINLCGTRFNLV